jgi:hypothetical protein
MSAIGTSLWEFATAGSVDSNSYIIFEESLGGGLWQDNKIKFSDMIAGLATTTNVIGAVTGVFLAIAIPAYCRLWYVSINPSSTQNIQIGTTSAGSDILPPISCAGSSYKCFDLNYNNETASPITIYINIGGGTFTAAVNYKCF